MDTCLKSERLDLAPQGGCGPADKSGNRFEQAGHNFSSLEIYAKICQIVAVLSLISAPVLILKLHHAAAQESVNTIQEDTIYSLKRARGIPYRLYYANGLCPEWPAPTCTCRWNSRVHTFGGRHSTVKRGVA